jgi:hypothetical protein
MRTEAALHEAALRAVGPAATALLREPLAGEALRPGA